jgi:signal transduction histidine kinase
VLVVAPTTSGTSDAVAAGVLIDVEALRVGAMSDTLADVISIEVHGATPTPDGDFVATRPIEIGERRYEVQVKPVPGSPIARPGSRWWAITAATAVLAGVLIGALAWVVLERRRVRSDLARARERDAARLEFLASVSHELRTPITAMTGFMQLLADDWDSLPDDERRDLVGLADEQGQEVAAMIADLLVLTRDSAAAINLAPQLVELPVLVDRVLNGVPSEYQGRVAADVPTVEFRTDPTRLAQVLRNLLVNGLIHGAGPVRLAARTTDSELVIRVSDNGPGVPPEFVDAIFEPFVSLPGASQSLPSNGVGLYVSRRIVEQMGGRLRYLRESDTTVFEVTLPMANDAAVAAPVAG